MYFEINQCAVTLSKKYGRRELRELVVQCRPEMSGTNQADTLNRLVEWTKVYGLMQGHLAMFLSRVFSNCSFLYVNASISQVRQVPVCI